MRKLNRNTAAQGSPFDRKMCYLGDSCRSDGNRSSRINSLQFHSFLKRMSSDRLGILGQTHQSQRENIQYQNNPQTPLNASYCNLNREMWNLKPLWQHLVVLCSQSFILWQVADPLSHLLPLFLCPQGRQVWSNNTWNNPNPIHYNWQNPYIL